MLKDAWKWLSSVPFTDVLERRQAQTIQFLLLTLIAPTVIDLIAMIFTPLEPQVLMINAGLRIFNLSLMLVMWYLLRHGHLSLTTKLLLGMVTLAMLLITGLTGILTQQIILLMWMVPLTLAGFLLGRMWIIGVALIALVDTYLVIQLEEQGIIQPPPGSGIGLFGAALFFCLIFIIVAIFMERFGSAFRQTISLQREREQELEALRSQLEQTVAERTSSLFQALKESEQREEELRRAMSEIDQQRNLIHSLSVPVIPISSNTLVMPLVGTLDSQRLLQVREQALRAMEHTTINQLVLDITGVSIVDEVVARGLYEVVQAARLLGTETVLVGIRPEVAQAMVSLQVDLPGLRTASTLQALLS
jgi:rsbT co-antagonist protein RsbR